MFIGYLGTFLFGVFLMIIGIRGIFIKPLPKQEAIQYTKFHVFQYTDTDGTLVCSIRPEK